MNGLTLHELGDERRVLDQFTHEAGGEETPEIKDLFDQLTGNIYVKVQNWGLWIAEREAEVEAIKAEQRRLADRKAATENAIERSKAQLLYEMQRLDLPMVRTPLATVSIQLNNPSLVGEVPEVTLMALQDPEDEQYDIALAGLVKYTPPKYELDRNAALRLAKSRPAALTTLGLTTVRNSSVRIK